MTCIVGVKDRGKVYIGGDSLGSNSWLQKTVRSDQKVFVKDEFAFGFTSSFRMGQILQYSFSIPTHSADVTDDMEYMVNVFIPALMKAFEEHGYGKHGNTHDKTGGVFLVGYRGELYKIENDFQVGKSTNSYYACGCGEDLALGALFVMNKALSPRTKIQQAIRAAAHHSGGVAEPIHIVHV